MVLPHAIAGASPGPCSGLVRTSQPEPISSLADETAQMTKRKRGGPPDRDTDSHKQNQKVRELRGVVYGADGRIADSRSTLVHVVRWQKGKHTESDPSLTKLQGRGKKKKKKGKGQRARRNPDRLPWGAAEIQSEARR